MASIQKTLRFLIFGIVALNSSLAFAGYELRGVVDVYEPASGYAVIDGQRYAIHGNFKVYASPRARQATSQANLKAAMRVGYTLSYDAANRASLTGVWILSR